jgi:short-subunit dehydrogenase
MSEQQLGRNFAGVITGASSGIGKALAVLLAQKYKAHLVLSGRNEPALSETADLVLQYGGQAELVIGDIGDNEVAALVVKQCLERFGAVDLLVNNAGLSKSGRVLSLTPDDWREVFAVNFFAPLRTIYEALPYMLKTGSGKIVNISSVAGKIAFPGSVCYAASKFALTGMSEGMAVELIRKNIDVITVCPGWVRSEFFAKNKLPDSHNPTKIAEQNNWQGWLMRNVLSISSESCAKSILHAIEKGGSQEIVLTAPGRILVGLNSILPGLTRKIAVRIKV